MLQNNIIPERNIKTWGMDKLERNFFIEPVWNWKPKTFIFMTTIYGLIK